MPNYNMPGLLLHSCQVCGKNLSEMKGDDS